MRIMMMLAVTLFWMANGGCFASADRNVQEGDIVFQSSRSSQSLAVQRATNSPYSHMGIILKRDGKPLVFEAGPTVRYTPLDRWIASGEGGHYVVRRLKNAPLMLTDTGIRKLHLAADEFAGRPYDPAFGWSDDHVYCSELVWKMYERALHLQIGKLQRMKDFGLNDPVVRTKLRERYGEKLPLEELVVSPAAVFNSPLFMTVTQR